MALSRFREDSPPTAPNAVIESIGVYLPANVMTTDQVLRACRHPIVFPLQELTGINTRRVVGPGEFSIDLASRAMSACFEQSDYGPGDIDLLICCNISRLDRENAVSFEPCTATKLRHSFGMGNATAMDITNACAGMFTAIFVVDCFFKAGAASRAMVVSGEYITNLMETAQLEITSVDDFRLACLTLGDAGAALILEHSKRPDQGFRDIEIYTIGEYSSLCIAKATKQKHGGAIMLTDSLQLMPPSIQESSSHFALLQRSRGWSTSSLHHVIMHQASLKAITDGAREVNRICGDEICRNDNLIVNLAERGNTASTTHVVALYDYILNDTIKPESNVIFSINASGITVGTAMYRMDDLPLRLRGQGRSPNGKGGSRQMEGNITPAILHSGVRIASIGIVPDWEPNDGSSVTLAQMAAEDCLQRSGRERGEVDLLIYAGVYRDEFMCEPAIATLIAGAIGINHSRNPNPLQERKKTLAFDVFNGGVGLLNACYLATQIIRSGRASLALVVTSEIDNNADQPTRRRLGIAQVGSAVLLEESLDSSGFGSFTFSAYPKHLDAYVSHATHDATGTFIELTKDPDLEAFYLECVAETLHKLLSESGIGADDIDVVLPPQISSAFTSKLSRRLELPHAVFPNADCSEGDLFTSSLPYSLEALSLDGRDNRSKLAAIINVGSGIQVGCALYRL